MMSQEIQIANISEVADYSGATTDVQLIQQWLALKGSEHTQRSYAYAADRFLRFLIGRRRGLRTCTVQDLQDWQDTLKGSQATRNQRLLAVRSLLSYANGSGYCQFNVGKPVKPAGVPDGLAERILTEIEVFKLLEAAEALGPVTAALVLFLYGSGARLSEALHLRWAEVHPDAQGAAVTLFGKRRKTRHVRIAPSVLAAMNRVPRTGDYVFGTQVWVTPRANFRRPGITCRQVGHLDSADAGRLIKAAVVEAGLPSGVSAHWLRHAHASHALDRGCPVHVVQATLGHASLETTTRYTHVKPGESSGNYLGVK